MNTSVEHLDGNTVKLTVTVPAATVDRSIDEAYKKVAAQTRIPGFRPGKAPRAVLDNKVGRDFILAEATEDLVNTTYPRALDAEKIRPIESPEMAELDTVQAGAEYTYVADVVVRPELTLSSIDDLTLEIPGPEATDDEVDGQIAMYRDRMATLEPIEDRGVGADDFILISFVGTVDGEGYEGNEVDKYLYEMNRGLMPPAFDEGLIGVEAGAETRIEFEVPDTTSNPDFIGKTAEFDVTVHEIKQKVLPEIDVEFVKNLGGFESVEDFRQNVREGIEVQKKYGYERTRERAVRELIGSRLEGDVPETMVVSKKGRLVRDLESSLEAREMSMNDYLAQTGLTYEGIDADLDKHADELVREELALEALFRQLEMEITESDLDAELEQMAEAGKSSAAEMRQRWEEMGLISVVEEELMHRKAMEWLSDNIEFIHIDPADAGTTNEAEDDDVDLPEQVAEFDVEPDADESE